jgi:DNA-binding transcriptional LysR family regulator
MCAERYKKTHPEVLVHLQVENTRRCCAAVARGEVNIAIVGGEIPRELEHLLQVCCSAHPPLTLPVQKL